MSGENWRTVLEAFATLVAASLAIRFLPFRRTAELMAKAVDRRAAATPTQVVNRCCWAVNAWANRVPWRAVCFQRGLTLHLMLRRRGIASTLHYGIAQSSEDGLSAHVWVETGGRIVMGSEEAGKFSRVASFPPAARG